MLCFYFNSRVILGINGTFQLFVCFEFTGSQILLEKLQKYKPKIAVFNGKLIFEVFSGKKDFSFGRQPEFVDGTNTVSL